MSNELISVVICSRNRATRLAGFFASLASLTYSNWELICVDNNSSDATSDTLDGLMAQLPLETTRLFEVQPGLGNARNAGLAVSKGSIIAFTDDDCYPAPDWLSQIDRALATPEIGFVGGKVLLHDDTDAKVAIQLRETPKAFPRFSYVYPGEIHGANMAFRREVLDEIGGFDPLLGAGQPLSAEDTDALNRAAAVGWDGLYVPDIVVSHHHGRKSDDAAKLQVDYAKGRGALLVKMLHGGSSQQKLTAIRALISSMRRRPKLARWELAGSLAYLRLVRQRAKGS
jgi:glycosyltransferase involved in cell wall biosynthesis